MSSLFVALFALVTSSFRTRVALQAEILALGHQLAVFQKNAPRRLRLQRSDRLLWVLLSRWWPGWRRSLHIVRPDTVIAWHRRAFACLWLPKSPSELKMQWFRAFVRSWWYHDELSFCCPFRFGHFQFSNPCRPAGGDPRASSSTRGFPEECTAAFAPPPLRPAFVGLAVTMVARLAPESTHRSPRYSDRLAP